jgi:hypothetical protein
VAATLSKPESGGAQALYPGSTPAALSLLHSRHGDASEHHEVLEDAAVNRSRKK